MQAFLEEEYRDRIAQELKYWPRIKIHVEKLDKLRQDRLIPSEEDMLLLKRLLKKVENTKANDEHNRRISFGNSKTDQSKLKLINDLLKY